MARASFPCTSSKSDRAPGHRRVENGARGRCRVPERGPPPGPEELPQPRERPPLPARFPRSTRPGQSELQLARSATMLLFPQCHHEGRQPDPQRRQAVDPGMTSRTQCHEKPSRMLARPAVMDNRLSFSAAGAAAVAVAGEGTLPVAWRWPDRRVLGKGKGRRRERGTGWVPALPSMIAPDKEHYRML